MDVMLTKASLKTLKLAAVSAVLAGCACGDFPMDEQMTKAGAAKMDEPMMTASTPMSPMSKDVQFEVKHNTLYAMSPGSPGGSPTPVRSEAKFSFDNALLPSRARRFLKTHAQFLRQNRSQNITIEGHCDERGTREYNLALGDLRGKAVADYLRSLGVNRSQINIISYGEEKPVDPGSTASAWARNRRAVVVYR